MNNKQVAHIWAQQEKEGGNGSHFYFNGPSIFSYGPHFEIARFIDKDTVFFTNRSYSNSTSRHMSYARWAINHKVIFFVDSFDSHSMNLKGMIRRLEEKAVLIARARTNAEYLVRDYQGMAESLRKYIEKFKSGLTPTERKDGRAALKNAEKQDFKAALERAKNAAALQIKRDALKQIQREQMEAAALAKWKAGENVGMYLRATAVRRVGDEIETTHGAKIPLIEGLRLYAKLKAGEPVHGERVGEFTVTSFDGALLKVGCHTIALAELDRLAATLKA